MVSPNAYEPEMNCFDYIVVGGGLAGLSTAHFLSERGAEVALITLGTLEESNSYYAQGGIAAVSDSSDTWQGHFEDTMEAGRGLCSADAVRVLTEEAPQRIEELIGMGMQFDTENGRLALGLEGGHHHHRILHAGGDATGRMITTFMIQQVQSNEHIHIFDHHLACEIVQSEGRCAGLWIYDEEAHEMELFLASCVVLATGGAGALYHPTTNPPTTLGDGIALAYRAGVKLMDMEFIQFHPTALYTPDGAAFLVSEAVRGEGAYLLDREGKRFMQDIHPLAELAPRDIVARSIFLQMKKQRTPYVTLSLKHLDPDLIRKRFPTITAHCEQLGMDMTHEIPVTPAAHYTVGGIQVDLNGATSLPCLYAVGEVASTGVMGANRLASNSLIECAVFAKRIAEHAQTIESPCRMKEEWASPFTKLLPKEKSDKWMKKTGEHLMEKLGKILMTDVGIIRSEEGLIEAAEYIEDKIRDLMIPARENISAFLVRQRYEVALLIARSANLRTESRGGHYRLDYPETLPGEESYHTRIYSNQITHIPLS